MLQRLRQRSTEEGGFTLIELLVVILIIGILAAIAIPSFLNQKSKAYDASAKELARTAQTTAETYATDHEGKYTGLSTKNMHEYESSIPENEAAAKGGAWLETPTGSAEEYTVTAVAANTGDKFSVHRTTNGEIERKCKSAKTGCAGTTESTW
jgi:type IV pilus assembly protein PilA